MKISELNEYLPQEVLKFYEAQGINELYPPQAQAVKLGIFQGKNILAAIPTASGKTLIAEFAMLNSILNKGGKTLYIVPLRALASEKYEYFSKFNIFNIKIGISTGDFDKRDEWLGRNDIIIATSEKADSLLRNQSPWMNEITVIVVDEIHLIDQADRGPTLEVTVAKLKKLNPNAQIIALSATIGNPEELASWLQAELLVSDFRPVELKEGVFFSRVIFFKEDKREIELEEKEETISLALDTVKEGGQCLIFTSTRRNAESIALRISRILKSKKLSSALDLSSEVEATAETEICRKLAACLVGGAAFHHAGLRAEHRKIVEDGFRRGKIKIIACTPTLAAGLNLPARRVIIKEYKRYDPNFGSQALPVLEVKQMGGRAGRPSLDPYGEAVLLAKSHSELLKLMAEYINAKPERIYSKLGSEPALRTHVLSLIATGFASTKAELQEFLMTTFFGFQRLDKGIKIEPLLCKLIAFFESEKMIIVQGEFLSPTILGSLISRLYIDPLSASIMIKALSKSKQPSTLALLHIICSTPDMRRLYLRSKDYDWILNALIEREHELLEHKSAFDGEEYEWYLSEVKTALMLESWISEEKEELITKRFNIGPGDIRALAETAEWLAHALAELAKHLKHPASKLARALEQRLRYGAAIELLPLIQLRDIGRVRARMLYNSGYRDLEALRNASVEELARVPAIGEKIARKILQQVWGGIGMGEGEEEKIIYKQSKLLE
ncbi:MAG: ATP-dependent DNA helicase [Methanocellales archaeon]